MVQTVQPHEGLDYTNWNTKAAAKRQVNLKENATKVEINVWPLILKVFEQVHENKYIQKF